MSDLYEVQLREKAASLLREADELRRLKLEAERSAAEARKPKMPRVTADKPAFVTFTRYLSGREYAYAAIGWRVGDNSVRWLVTSSENESRRRNWPGLLTFIGEANWSSIRPLIPGEPLITPEDEPLYVEHVGPSGRVIRTETPRFGDGRDGDYL